MTQPGGGMGRVEDTDRGPRPLNPNSQSGWALCMLFSISLPLFPVFSSLFTV